jgi:hypothetical protein
MENMRNRLSIAVKKEHTTQQKAAREEAQLQEIWVEEVKQTR